MPPDAAVDALGRRTLDLWRELHAAYDALGPALAAPEADALGALARRIAALEHELAPLVEQLRARRARGDDDASQDALWREIDRVVESLVERSPALVRAALAARDGVAERLARRSAARARVERYAAAPPATLCTSRRA